MQQQTRDLLAALEDADWFSAVGQAVPKLPQGQAIVASSWAEAVECCGSISWENYTLEQRNLLTICLHDHARDRYQRWNEIVCEMKAAFEPLVERKIRRVVEEHALPEVVGHCVRRIVLTFDSVAYTTSMRRPSHAETPGRTTARRGHRRGVPGRPGADAQPGDHRPVRRGPAPHGLRVGQLNLLVAVARMGTARPGDLCRVLEDGQVHAQPGRGGDAAQRLAGSGRLGRRTGPPLRISPDGRPLLEAVVPAWRQAQERAGTLIGGDGAASLRQVGSIGSDEGDRIRARERFSFSGMLYIQHRPPRRG